MKPPLHSLRQEIESLRQRLDEQDDDITRLKTRLFDLELLLKNQQGKQPAH